MTIKAFNEAARALVMWTALQGDISHRSGDEQGAAGGRRHMGLLTPVVKGVLTDMGFANTVMAQQMFGGHGYIARTGMEQFVRDARIADDLRRRQRHPGARPRRAQARRRTAAAR